MWKIFTNKIREAGFGIAIVSLWSVLIIGVTMYDSCKEREEVLNNIEQKRIVLPGVHGYDVRIERDTLFVEEK